ncbi:MAG: DNA glycosylase [Clostridiales bacterium]|jgi:N-glycosylase/DNA lyase|nr:DNA glycosylase [Clostridiales bacterium]
MRVSHQHNKLIVSDRECFDIKSTLECGQCFRFTKISDAADQSAYRVVAKDKLLFMTQVGDVVTMYPIDAQEVSLWTDYFDLDRDYSVIKEHISADMVIKSAWERCDGIRILRQDPWEALVSFIISQNNNIPRIKGIVETLAKRFGEPIASSVDEILYSFPTPQRLATISLNELLDCKVGFRAKYILNAATRVATGNLCLESLGDMNIDEAREQLMSIYGVGRKISDCVLLFAYGKTEVFPADVWIKRIVAQRFFNGAKLTDKDIQNFAANKFGEYAGFAQQYLYAYARDGAK